MEKPVTDRPRSGYTGAMTDCLPEDLLLRLGPHVDELAFVVEEERVGGQAVRVDELAPPLVRR